MPLKLIGIHYRHCDLETRERLAFSDHDQHRALQELMAHPDVDEAWLLSTCGRVELAIVGRMSTDELSQWMVAFHRWPYDPIREALRHYEYQAAIEHMLRVACGLDSAIVGEPQILGQFKRASHMALEAGTQGPVLKTLLPAIQRCAKGIRHHLGLHQHTLTLPSTTLALAREQLIDFQDKHILVMGAGDIVQSFVPYLAELHQTDITFCNRSLDKAHGLSEQVARGHTVPMNDLASVLPQVDLIITATSTPLPLLGLGLLEDVVARRSSPLLIFDLAVPRDVEAQVARLPGVTLHNIDELHAHCQRNQDKRSEAAQRAEALVTTHTHHLLEEWRLSQASHTVAALREPVETMRDAFLRDAKKRLEAGQDPYDVLQCTVYQLTQAWLHQPTQCAKQAAIAGEDEALAWLKKAFSPWIQRDKADA